MRDLFGTMELHAVPDALSFPSLVATHVKCGDILFLPGGTLVVEKTINECSLAFRVYSLYMDGVALDGFRIAMKQAHRPSFIIELKLKFEKIQNM